MHELAHEMFKLERESDISSFPSAIYFFLILFRKKYIFMTILHSASVQILLLLLFPVAQMHRQSRSLYS